MNGINSVKNYKCWFLVKQKTKNKKIKKWGKKVSWHPHLYILLINSLFVFHQFQNFSRMYPILYLEKKYHRTLFEVCVTLIKGVFLCKKYTP